MINIFISALFLMCSVSMFSLSFRIDGLNRTIINAPMTIFEYSVPIYGDGLEIDLSYNQDVVTSKYEEYLESTIYKYVSSYQLDFRFYDIDNQATCRDACKGVEVHISAPILVTYQYNRTMFYEIRKA